MKILRNAGLIMLLASLFGLTPASPASAHLMPAGHGTLNVVDNAVFMVLSLPVSAFSWLNLDQDGDGELSPAEINLRRGEIIAAVNQRVILSDSRGKAALVGVMLSFERSHGDSQASVSELTVLGRFNANEIPDSLLLEVNLFGKDSNRQSLEIRATRKEDAKEASFILTPDNPVGRASFTRYTF